MTKLEAVAEDLYGNAEWRVSDEGMQHRQSGYAIERAMLGARRRGGLWEWPLHLSEKSWCSPRPFREAFLAALDLFAIERDQDLTRSFAIALAAAPTASRAPRAEAVRLGAVVATRSIERKRAQREDAAPRPSAAAIGRMGRKEGARA